VILAEAQEWARITEAQLRSGIDIIPDAAAEPTSWLLARRIRYIGVPDPAVPAAFWSDECARACPLPVRINM
jgi:hypothetical protein